jgi:hypothetical protein
MDDQFLPLEFTEKTPDDIKADSSAYFELMRRRRSVRDFSNRPDDEKPYLFLLAGYPGEDATVPAISKLPLEAISTFI